MKEITGIPKLRNWKKTLDKLSEEKGITLKEVCEYTGAAYNENGISFYVKLPKKRTAYIGIGMALRQPVETINEWITYFGGKKKLYAKDISEDLVWIYLINANLNDEDGRRNYFKSYEDYQSAAYSVFRERWDEIVLRNEDTADIEITLGQAEYGPEFDGLKTFVAEHMDAFKTAYSKPRKYLDRYVDSILTACRTHPTLNGLKSLNSLRGYLDDSMINFLSGDSETVNVVDRKTGKKTINIKHIPKGRKKYINLCISLGMTTEDIDRYLEMMGYAPLDINDKDERVLIDALTDWENRHPAQRTFKAVYIDGTEKTDLSEEEKHIAVEQMLQLRSDLTEYYNRENLKYTFAN